MKLYFRGHDYKYAAEQMLLTMFPQERPEYPRGAPEGDRMELSLSSGGRYTTALCSLYRGGQLYRSRATAEIPAELGDLEADRIRQRLIKNAMYRSALKSGVKKPAWGALTGVRPGKLLEAKLSSGMGEEQALRQFVREYDVSPERAALCLDTSRETMKAAASLGPRDVCLYVGIPFCPTRCAYCSFVSQSVEKSMKLIAPFHAALHKELKATAEQLRELGLTPVSIYMGGGTPTTLSAGQLDELCSWIEEEFDLSSLREYTVEAGRPDTITQEKLLVLGRHGVDRLSVNPQTMEDSVLELIGRRHTARDIVSALELVRAAGGFAVNMDLIAGLPQDTPEGFERTLAEVLALAPENITVHTLSMKRGSTLSAIGGALPGAEDVARMLDAACAALYKNGYGPYYLYRQKYMSGGFENVGWTRPGFENLYNIYIMEELTSIISMGAGGSAKLVAPGRIKRFFAPKYPLEYIKSIDGIQKGKERITEFYGL